VPAPPSPYRGRLAPSPTGFLHLGHARTFWVAQQRALQHHGTLILRNEDLDPDRCRPEFVVAMIEDLHWFGFSWLEGPDCGGPFAPYDQSRRGDRYRSAFERLKAGGSIYPCCCSRKDVQRASQAPHAGDDEPIYPGTCRPSAHPGIHAEYPMIQSEESQAAAEVPAERRTVSAAARVNWRFQVPDGVAVRFDDGGQGPQVFVAGRDFGDFVVWRHDGVPSYQLAVVVDDAAMRITEVVRGADLLVSTARQLLLYQALGLTPPSFYHCPLVTDAAGIRLAKRHDALSLRRLREQGEKPETWRETWRQAH
jgi:glutamyl/glutaminyl-tRNA synthetase